MSQPTNAQEWLTLGIERGWCGPRVCSTHDGIPMTSEEESGFEDGDDPCVWIVRAYLDDERLDVEAVHSPSIWRKA